MRSMSFAYSVSERKRPGASSTPEGLPQYFNYKMIESVRGAMLPDTTSVVKFQLKLTIDPYAITPVRV